MERQNHSSVPAYTLKCSGEKTSRHARLGSKPLTTHRVILFGTQRASFWVSDPSPFPLARYPSAPSSANTPILEKSLGRFWIHACPNSSGQLSPPSKDGAGNREQAHFLFFYNSSLPFTTLHRTICVCMCEWERVSDAIGLRQTGIFTYGLTLAMTKYTAVALRMWFERKRKCFSAPRFVCP